MLSKQPELADEQVILQRRADELTARLLRFARGFVECGLEIIGQANGNGGSHTRGLPERVQLKDSIDLPGRVRALNTKAGSAPAKTREKSLDPVFTAAKNANSILFFNEADALFGKRSEVRDSHDRYANIEISYLLQKMEEYDGIAILATNLRQNLDDAFMRRLAFTVHFPFPDEASRRQIWTGIWPAETQLDGDIDLDFLARQFKVSGGNIKNIALATAFLAAEDERPVAMTHLFQATRREHQKMGKTLPEDQLGGALHATPSAGG
jgi:hypothetical protein